MTDGKYTGKVMEIEYEQDTFNEPDGIVACIKVALDGQTETVVCRHRSHGEHADKTLDTLESLGLPRELKSLARLGEIVGKTIRVNVKTSAQGRQNAYVATSKTGAKLSLDEINRRLNDDENVPF